MTDYLIKKSITVSKLITCCGLYSDDIVRKSGMKTDIRILPVRGEYRYINTSININTNIYPVPNLEFPFLGVHITPTMNGKTLLGPNAILAFSKEGYKYYNISLFEMYNYILFEGFYSLIKKYYSFGLHEFYYSITNKIDKLQNFINLSSNDLSNQYYSGVRAQAIDKNGNFVEDFVLVQDHNILHVVNAPSPGATSCLAIAELICDKISD